MKVRSCGARVLAVSSGGGHWLELLRVREAFEGAQTCYVTVESSYRSDVPSGARFHCVVDVTRWNKVKWIVCALQLLCILLRERPTVVVSTGALPGFLALRIAHTLRIRTIWIDSIANADELSRSGQLAGAFADLWITQWEHLSDSKGPRYFGAVL